MTHRVLVGQKATQIELVDDVAHAGGLLLAQATAAALGLRRQTRALLRAQFVPLQRNRFHSGLERIAPKCREQRHHGCENSDADQNCRQ